MSDAPSERSRSSGPGHLLWGLVLLVAAVALLILLVPVAECGWCGAIRPVPADCGGCRGRGRLTLLSKWRLPPPPFKWDRLMADLRAGGGFDDPLRPEGRAFARVKAMGGAAYPRLIGYMDNEDIMLARSAVAVMNALTRQERRYPTEANKAALKAEWETWLDGQR